MAEDIPVSGPGGTPPSRADYDATYPRTGYPSFMGVGPAAARRVSWGAIFAGAVVALVVELMLGTLGLAVALGNINPATETRTFEGMGVGAGIWFVVTTLVALYAGGWAAGRLAGSPRRPDAILHGVVTWGLVTLFSTWMLSSLVGGVVSGAVNAVGATLGMVGQGVGAVASQQLGQAGGTNVGAEVEKFLRQTGDPQLSPEALRRQAARAEGQAGAAAGQAGQAGGNALDAIQAALGKLSATGQNVVSEVDRQDAINVIVARTNLTEAQASGIVDSWIQTWTQFRSNLPTTAEVQQTAAQVTEDVSGALGSFMFWSFVSMVIGLGAAMLGGSTGAPKDIPVAIATVGASPEH